MTQFREGLPHHSSDLPEAPADSVRSLDDPSIIGDLEAYSAALQRGEYPDRKRLLAKYPGLAE